MVRTAKSQLALSSIAVLETMLGNNCCDGLPTPQHSALATIESLSTVENDLNTLIAEEGEKTKILARGPKNAESSGQKQP
jgi:hypothetical protein